MSARSEGVGRGFVRMIASALATYATLAAIAMFASFDAALWFGAGAFFTAVVALWEAGHNARKRERTGEEA